MKVEDHPVMLGIDFGTTNTVAVLRSKSTADRPLLFDGSPVLPSAVYLDESGTIHVGRQARRMAQLDPARYEPHPKQRLSEGTVLLGTDEVPSIDLAAAVLQQVRETAVSTAGSAPPTVITYPAGWGTRRIGQLREAAAVAGIDLARLVAEPVAAAHFYARLQDRVPPGPVAVFDMGGGTFDTALVLGDGNGAFTLASHSGQVHLGGIDLDQLLVAHLGRLVAKREPEAWNRISNPQSARARRDHRQFWDDVRDAKEMLSRSASAPVAIPGAETALHLTREELESLASPLITEAVGTTRRVIGESGFAPGDLAGLFLVGGASRMPLVGRILHSGLGVAPSIAEQPELVVAHGALDAQSTADVTTSPPLTSPTLPAAPTTPPAASGPPTPPMASRSPQYYTPQPPDPDPQQARQFGMGPVHPTQSPTTAPLVPPVSRTHVTNRKRILVASVAGLTTIVLLVAFAIVMNYFEDNPGSENPELSDGGGTEEGIIVGFVQTGQESAWRVANTDSIIEAAESDERIDDLVYVDGQQDQQRQIDHVRDLIEQAVDVIVLAPVVSGGWTATLKEAETAGIPVILNDRRIDEADMDLVTTSIGLDFAGEGATAGRWAADEFGGSLQMVEITGTTAIPVTMDRHDGFFAALDAEGVDYEVLADEVGDWSVQGGEQAMEEILQNVDIGTVDLLFAHNDSMALGAVEALETAGINPGTDVKITSIDGTRAAFEAGSDGQINYIVEASPVWGELLMDLVVDASHGVELDAEYHLEVVGFGEGEFADEIDRRPY